MKSIRVLSVGLLLPFATLAQQKMLTVEEAVLKQRTTLGPEKLAQLSWIPNSHLFAWVAKSNGRECIVREDAATMKQDTILRIDDFKEVVSSANPDIPKLEKFPLITWVDADHLRITVDRVLYSYDLQTKIIKPLVKTPKDAEDIDYEQTNNRVAYTLNNNLMVSDKAGLQRPVIDQADGTFIKSEMITTDGTYGLVNGKAVHRNEFGINKGTFWSPKGNKLAYYKMMEYMVSDYSLLEINNNHAPVRAKNIKYPMAGNASHKVKVVVQDYTKNRSYEVGTGNPSEDYLTNICWSPDEQYLFLAVVNRDQNEMKLNMYDGMTGVFIKTLFTETHAKYVEPEHPMIFVKNNAAQFIWFSERDGHNHLYLYDLRGKLIRQLTKGGGDVTQFLGFDQAGTTIFYIMASEDGLNRYCYSMDMKTGKTVKITHNPGMHNVLLCDDGSYLLDTYSNTTTPGRTTLMDRTGGERAILVNSPNPLAAYKPCGIRMFSIPSADQQVQLNCRMFYPPQFDSSHKYPVLVYLYGGPHAQMVTNSWLGGADMWLYYMAQQGFVVFTMDNRGSSNRGIDFENATFRRLGTVEREDQSAGAEFLRRQRYVDTTRMGVFGWSYGGFMSINMMTRTPYFKVAVAGGPVIDWSMYEVMYTERYMDRPQDNPEGYKDADLTNYIKNLNGKLMLIHGTSDDVVLWQQSLNYIKKTVEEGVQVDYFVYPEHKHNVLGKDRVHLMQKVADYFKQNL